MSDSHLNFQTDGTPEPPKAYGGCTCSCHRGSGIIHCVPCCRPSDRAGCPICGKRGWCTCGYGPEHDFSEEP